MSTRPLLLAIALVVLASCATAPRPTTPRTTTTRPAPPAPSPQGAPIRWPDWPRVGAGEAVVHSGSGAGVGSLEVRISAHLSDAPLRDALAVLTSATGIALRATDGVDPDRAVSLRMRDVPLRRLLTSLAEQAELACVASGATMVFTTRGRAPGELFLEIVDVQHLLGPEPELPHRRIDGSDDALVARLEEAGLPRAPGGSFELHRGQLIVLDDVLGHAALRATLAGLRGTGPAGPR